MNGRLTSSGSGTYEDRRNFYDIITGLGLTFGQIEAELRQRTGYKEGA
jgi:hypothetical protein